MANPYARPLNKKYLVEEFLDRCLGYKEDDLGDTILKILKEEILIDKVPQNLSTLNDSSFRHPDYSDDISRKFLRKRIFEELLEKTRLDDESKISLGNGGAKPLNEKKEAQAIIVTGLPASGKSKISIEIANEYGAYIIDPDYAKLKLPEYKIFGANIVHKESTAIVRGSEATKLEGNLLGACLFHKINVVIPTIGQSIDDLRAERDMLLGYEYNVHLLSVSVDKKISTFRALKRFLEDGRYVSLGLIFDGYSNDPSLSYHNIKNDNSWASYGEIYNEHQAILNEWSGSGPASLFK